MNYSQQKSFDYFSSSIKSSRIPKPLTNFFNETQFQDNQKLNKENKFWHKFNALNLNGKKSKIPIKKSRTTIILNNLSEDQITRSQTDCLELDNKSSDNWIKSNSTSSKVKLRSRPGRSGLTLKTNSRTKSDPTDYLYLKGVLEIVRSNLSADNKLKSIKRYRDSRLGLISEMQTYSDNKCDDRVREWVDSGYMSNSNINVDNIRQREDAFISNKTKFEAISKCDASVNTALSLSQSPQHIWPRRRSSNRAMDLIALNNRYNSFNSDISMSSISSIESILELRREDPEELLLSLGFGYVPDEQPINRIPQRFLESPSAAKGVSAELLLQSCNPIDASSLSSSASFSPTVSRERSYSCGFNKETLRKRLSSKDPILKIELPEITTSTPSTLQSPPSDSILNPANRKFLESQGKQEEVNHLGSKRLIIGTKSYKLDLDGDPLAIPKTPSPTATTPVQIGINNELIITSNNNNESDSSLKKRFLKRQSCVSDTALYTDLGYENPSITDMSSELSSSTTTLVGTVIGQANDTTNVWIHNSDLSSDKCNAFSQTDNQSAQSYINETVEAAFVVAIQSLRLSLEFYGHQSLKLAQLSAQKYKQSSNDFTEEDLNSLSKINQLRDSIHQELVDMDSLLNKHLNDLKTTNVLEKSFISQAKIFTEAVKKMTELLKEQQNIYSRLDLIKLNDE